MSGEERVGVSLKVTEAKHQRDVGRSVARIDSSAMQALGVTVGDVIEIQGKMVTPAKAWPAYPEDQGLDLIRIDGFIRKNCGISLNELVTVKKAQFNYADHVTLAPIDTRISVDNDFVRFVKDRLIDRPVVRGDTILIMMRGHSIPFMVVNTRPSGIVKISPTTEVKILGEPISERKLVEMEKNRKHLRFSCLKWAEAMYAADETWFYLPGRDERSKDETAIVKVARKVASEEDKTVEIRVELLEKRGSIDPEGFSWAEINPQGEIQYTYPEEWLEEVLRQSVLGRRD